MSKHKKDTKPTEQWSFHDMPTLPPSVAVDGLPPGHPFEGQPSAEQPLPDAEPTRVVPQGNTFVSVSFPDQLVFQLDHLLAEIKANSGVTLKRAEVIRALVGGVINGDIDLRMATSEQELMAIISLVLRKRS